MSQIVKPQKEYPYPIPAPENLRKGGVVMDWYPDGGFVIRLYHPQPGPDFIRLVEKQEMKLYNFTEPNNSMVVSVFSFGIMPQFFLSRFDPCLLQGPSESLFQTGEAILALINSKTNIVIGTRKLKLPDNYLESIRKMHAASKNNENFSFSYLTWTNMVESRYRLDDLAMKGKLLTTWR